MQCKDTIPKNVKQIFTKKKLRGLSHNFHIHVYVCDLYISTIGLPAHSAAVKYVD